MTAIQSESHHSGVNRFLKNILGPVVPYITVGLGFLVFHNAWITLISYHLGMLAVVYLSPEHPPLKFLFGGKNRILSLVAALGGACGGLLLYLLWPLLSVPTDISLQLQSLGLNRDSWPFFLVYFILLNAGIEEYYWRGLLSEESKFPIPNDLFFAGYHLMVLAGKVEVMWLIAVLAVLVLAAWAWRQFNRLGRGLLPSLASHLAADITVIFTIYRLTSG
jgi:hypothetical protein